jgi:hypothetical protein
MKMQMGRKQSKQSARGGGGGGVKTTKKITLAIIKALPS